MKKRFIIKKSQEFREILNTNQKVNTPSYLLFYRSSGYAFNRVGIAVSRKKYSVVMKNKIKRQIRAMFRDVHCRKLWPWTGIDLIVLVKKHYLATSFATNLQVLLRGLNLISPKLIN